MSVGRPEVPDSKKAKRITITLPPELLDYIDLFTMNRSATIQMMIEEHRRNRMATLNYPVPYVITTRPDGDRIRFERSDGTEESLTFAVQDTKDGAMGYVQFGGIEPWGWALFPLAFIEPIAQGAMDVEQVIARALREGFAFEVRDEYREFLESLEVDNDS